MKGPSNLLLPPLAFLMGCVSSASVMGADNPPPPKPAAADAAPATSAGKPMITDNPDGTFTIQKAPPKDAKGDYKGLVIPPQVVVPFVRLPEKKPSPPPQQTNP